jgi:hypothetical protein
MIARLQRKAPLPDKHLLQIRIYRTTDPEIYAYLERLEIGEISARIKSAIKRGIGSAATGEGIRASTLSGDQSSNDQTSYRGTPAPIAADHAELTAPTAPREVAEQVAPPVSVAPAQAMDPELLRLLAEEDASS